MVIAHIVSGLEASMGGPSVVAFALAGAQAVAGHEVRIVSYLPAAGNGAAPITVSGSEAPRLFQLADVPGAACLSLHLTPHPGGLRRTVAWGSGGFLADATRGAEIIHVHGVWDPFLSRAIRAKHAPPFRGYVITPHGMLDPWSLAQKRWKKKAALAWVWRRLLQGAGMIHALNTTEAELLRPLQLRTPVEVVPNGIFPEQLADIPPAGTFRDAHPEIKNDPYILFLARLHMKKGLDYLADAFADVAGKIPKVRLVVAGPDEGAREPFIQRIRVAGVEDRVHVVGPLYDRLKLAALADAALFCLPSRQEGFSVAVLEAMACRTPVLLSEECHFPEVGPAGAGLVVPLRAERFAAAALQLLSDPDGSRAMGEAGRRLVLSRYTWPAIADAMVDAYRRHLPGLSS